MRLIEQQIIVENDSEGNLWFTLQERKVYFLFRGFWKNIYPMWQPTYVDACKLKKLKL